MAIINCPECNEETSDAATNCPHCGYPIKNNFSANENESSDLEFTDNSKESNNSNFKKVIVFISAIIVVICIAIGVFFIATSNSRNCLVN